MGEVLGEPAFPTEGIVPEHRQIGRTHAIDGLERRLRDSDGGHWTLIDDRKIGKSSSAIAALARLRTDPAFVTVVVDLRQLGIRDEAQLVDALRRAGVTAGIEPGWVSRLGRRGKVLLQGKGPASLSTLGALLGIAELADAGKITTAFAGMLSPDSTHNLRQQLLLFEAWALASEKTVVLFIDEVQDLARWGTDTVEALAATMSYPLRRVRLLFAGSEKDSMEALFAKGRPLHDHALTYNLPRISREDWLHALPRRFDEMGITVEREALEAAVDATVGRPLQTNQVCLQAAHNVFDFRDGAEPHVSAAIMQYAIDLVRERERRGQGGDEDA